MNEEIKAMRAIANALDGLADDAARQRVLRWVLDFHGVLVGEVLTTEQQED